MREKKWWKNGAEMDRKMVRKWRGNGGLTQKWWRGDFKVRWLRRGAKNAVNGRRFMREWVGYT